MIGSPRRSDRDHLIALGVDQAARSGWGIVDGANVLEHGVATDFAARRDVVARAIERAGGPTRLLVAFEDHGALPLQFERRGSRTGQPGTSTAAHVGLGDARGRWNEWLDAAGHPERLRLLIAPDDWRGRVHGTVSGDVKGAAVRWASNRLGERIDDHDEAEGLCLACFAALDGPAILEQGRLKRRLYARGKRNERRQLELGEGSAR